MSELANHGTLAILAGRPFVMRNRAGTRLSQQKPLPAVKCRATDILHCAGETSDSYGTVHNYMAPALLLWSRGRCEALNGAVCTIVDEMKCVGEMAEGTEVGVGIPRRRGMPKA